MPTGVRAGRRRRTRSSAPSTSRPRRVGVDPVEIRRRNFIAPDKFPFQTSAGLLYDSGNYAAALDRALELVGYDTVRAEQAARRARGEAKHLGIGISSYVEMCGLAPSRVLGQLNFGAGGWEHATVRVLPTGKVEVVTGTSPHGQGHETSWSMIAADLLGVPQDDVEVLHSDTAISHLGLDTYGSRWLSVGGMAVHHTVRQDRRERRRAIAAHEMEVSPDDLEFSEGDVPRGRDAPRARSACRKRHSLHFAAHNLPEGMEPNLTTDASYDPTNFTFPFGTHIAVVEVDEDTGVVEIERLRRGRRLRRSDQPSHRRRADPRRHPAGHRAGPVGGDALRREREPADGIDDRLPRAVGSGGVEPRDGVDGHAEPNHRDGCEGDRRGRHDRRDPCGDEHGDRRPPASSACTDIDMPASPERVWRAIQEARR